MLGLLLPFALVVWAGETLSNKTPDPGTATLFEAAETPSRKKQPAEIPDYRARSSVPGVDRQQQAG